jgi:hypothetical protein
MVFGIVGKLISVTEKKLHKNVTILLVQFIEQQQQWLFDEILERN